MIQYAPKTDTSLLPTLYPPAKVAKNIANFKLYALIR